MDTKPLSLVTTSILGQPPAELISTIDVRAVEFVLESKQSGEWHYHSEIVEYCYCLSGQVVIELAGKQSYVLAAGEKLTIAIGNIHRVSNFESIPCRYLVVQGVGTYDFIQVESLID